MTLFMEILKIWLEEQLLIKYCVIKPLILLNIQKIKNQCGLVSKVYKFFGKKSLGSGIKNQNISNKELAEKLHKQIIIKFKKREVHSPFTNNISGADLAINK